VIFTDRRYPIAAHKADVMAARIRRCRRCSVLDVVNAPIDLAQQQMPAIVSSLLHRFGTRFGYMLSINGIYVGGARGLRERRPAGGRSAVRDRRRRRGCIGSRANPRR